MTDHQIHLASLKVLQFVAGKGATRLCNSEIADIIRDALRPWREQEHGPIVPDEMQPIPMGNLVASFDHESQGGTVRKVAQEEEGGLSKGWFKTECKVAQVDMEKVRALHPAEQGVIDEALYRLEQAGVIRYENL